MTDENDTESFTKSNSNISQLSPDPTATTMDTSVSSSQTAQRRLNGSRRYRTNNSTNMSKSVSSVVNRKGLEDFHASVRMLHEDTCTAPPMSSQSEVNATATTAAIPTSEEEMERRHSSFTSFVDHAKTYWTDLGNEAEAMKTGKTPPMQSAQVNADKNHVRPTLNYVRSDSMTPHRDISIYPTLPKMEPTYDVRPSSNTVALEAFQKSHAQKIQAWKVALEKRDRILGTTDATSVTTTNNTDHGYPQKVITPQQSQCQDFIDSQQNRQQLQQKGQEREKEEEVSIFELFERRRQQKRQAQAQGRVQQWQQQQSIRSLLSVQGGGFSTMTTDSRNSSSSKNMMTLSSSDTGTRTRTAYQEWLSASTSALPNINDNINKNQQSPRRDRRKQGADHNQQKEAKQDNTATTRTMGSRNRSKSPSRSNRNRNRSKSPSRSNRRSRSDAPPSSPRQRQRQQMNASVNSCYPSEQAKQDENKSETGHSDSQGSTSHNLQQSTDRQRDQKQNETTRDDISRGMDEATLEQAKQQRVATSGAVAGAYPSQQAKEDHDSESGGAYPSQQAKQGNNSTKSLSARNQDKQQQSSSADGMATAAYPPQQAQIDPTAEAKKISPSSAIISEQAIRQQQQQQIEQHRQRQEQFRQQQQQSRGINGRLPVQPQRYTGSLITAEDLDDTEHRNRPPPPSQPPASPVRLPRPAAPFPSPGTSSSLSSTMARRRRALEDASQKARSRNAQSTSSTDSNSNNNSQETLPGAYQASPGRACQRNRAIRNSVISSHSLSAFMSRSRRGDMMSSCRSFAIDSASLESANSSGGGRRGSAIDRNKRASLTSIVSIEEEKRLQNTADDFYEPMPTYSEELREAGDGEGHADVEADRQQMFHQKMAASMVIDSDSSLGGEESDEFWHPSLPPGRTTKEIAKPPPFTGHIMDGSAHSNRSAAPSPPPSPPSRRRHNEKPTRHVVRRTNTQASQLSNLTNSNESCSLDNEKEEEKQEIEPFCGEMENEDKDEDSTVPPLLTMSRQSMGPRGMRVGSPNGSSAVNIVPNRTYTLPLSQRLFGSVYTAQSGSGHSINHHRKSSLMSVSENEKSLDDSTSDFSMPSFRQRRSTGTSSSGTTSEAAKNSATRIARNMSLYMRAGALPVAATVVHSDSDLEEELREKLELEIRQELEIEMEEFRRQLILEMAAEAQPVTADVIPVDVQRLSLLSSGNNTSLASLREALEERQRVEAAAVRSDMNRELGRLYLQMKSQRSLRQINDDDNPDGPFYDVEMAEINGASKNRTGFCFERFCAVLVGAGIVVFIYQTFL